MNRYRGAAERRRVGGTLALALGLLALTTCLVFPLDSGPAHSGMGPRAHPSEHAHVSTAHAFSAGPGVRSSSCGIAIALLALSSIGLGPIRRRVRQAALVSLSLLVAVLALESAVHSVHHLSDAGAAAGCVVLSASPPVTGAGGGPDVGAPALAASAAPVVEGEGIRPLQPFRPFAGRAPPAGPSV